MTEDQNTFDYIVVGGGSAGCIVAARLAEEDAGSVLLLERGEPAEKHPETLTAEGYKYAFSNDAVIWERFTVPQKHCGYRRLFAGSGKGMGGSGSVNGMVYTRGDKRDYAQWPNGWQWDDVVPAFEAMEKRMMPNCRTATKFTKTAVNAAKEVGFEFKEDLNDGDLGGYFGYEWMNYKDNERRSSYVSWIKDNPKLENLTIKTSAVAQRILFDENLQSTGIEVNCAGKQEVFRCNKEIIMCAGSLETPKLLMLSGIGPRADLEKMGIEVLVEDDRIGANFHDHPNVTLFFKGDKEVDAYFPQLYGFTRTNPEMDLPEGQPDTCYVMYPVRSSFHQAMKRMLPAVTLPMFLYNSNLVRKLMRGLIDFMFKFKFVNHFVNHMYGIVVILGKPASRGRVRLRSKDPLDDLDIDPNFYAAPEDMDTMVLGVEKARAMAASKSFSEWGNKALLPSAGVQDRKKIENWIHSATMTTFHYTGTVHMGNEEVAPTDTQLNLKCVKGVRIADASAVPVVPVSAMNAPSMLIGYQAADLIIKQSAS